MIFLPTLTTTERLAQRLAPHLRRGDMLALAGPLGAGKTTFARALLHALGIAGEVPSPTFTLLQTYDVKNFPVYHFDLYRIKNAAELDELGWDDALAGGLVVAEWPERAGGRIPPNHLTLRFAMNGERQCIIEANGTWTQRMTEIKL